MNKQSFSTNKHKIVPLSALTLIMLGGAIAGISSLSPSVAHAQKPVTQVGQSIAPEATDKEVPGIQEKAETTEPANANEAAEKNIPGNGHQDADGTTVDNQFEGAQ